jgi:hypothetical protein
MKTGNDVYVLPKIVLRVSKSIRHCAVIDRSGDVVSSITRKNVKPLVTDENRYREALQTAIRYSRTPAWASNLGRMWYNVGRYEKVIGATIPISNRYLMTMAFDHDTDDFDEIIMKKILPIVKRMFDNGL